MPPRSVQAARGGFLRNVNLIFFTQVTNYGLVFVLNVLLARGLEPEGRGAYALFVLSTTLLASIGTLGAGLGGLYYLGKGRHQVRVLLANGLLHAALLGLVVGLLAVPIASVLAPSLLLGGDGVWVLSAAFPVVLIFLLLIPILMGEEDFLGSNLASLTQTSMVVLAVLALYVIDELTTPRALAMWSASFGAGALVALAFIRFRHWSGDTPLRPNVRAFREQVALGFPGQAGNLLQFLNYRLDQFVVSFLRGTAAVGVYAVAVGLAESVWWIANAVSVALLPRLTKMQSERAGEVAPIACRNTLLISLLAALGLAAAAPLIVHVLFGEAYTASVVAILWLVPGVALLGGAKVLSSFVMSQGRPVINSVIALATVGATLLLDILLIPAFGIAGAAMASSLAYTLTFMLSLYAYQRLSGNSAWLCVVPRLSDVELYAGVARQVYARVPRTAMGVRRKGA